MPLVQQFGDINMGGKPNATLRTIAKDKNAKKFRTRTEINDMKTFRKNRQKPRIKQRGIRDPKAVVDMNWDIGRGDHHPQALE
jgi:hypothetical protein